MRSLSKSLVALSALTALATMIAAWGLAAAGCTRAEATRLEVTYYYLPG